MNSKNLLIGSIAIVILGVVLYTNFRGSTVKEATNTTTQVTPSTTSNPSGTVGTADWKNDAENTTSVFMNNVNTPGYGNNINVAFSKLTSSTQAIVTANSPNSSNSSLAQGLAYFIGVQEAPDKGTSITSSEKLNDGTVRVMTKWNYSGSGSITKTFILLLEDGQWKIDKKQ